jgi:hypothetical protein
MPAVMFVSHESLGILKKYTNISISQSEEAS